MKLIWRILVAFVPTAILGVIFRITNDLFFLVSGSESTSFMAAPSVVVQGASLFVFAITLVLFRFRLSFAPLALLAIGAALMGGHRLLVDNLHHRIMDIYCGVPVNTVPLDPADEAGLAITKTDLGLTIGLAGGARTLWVFSPPVIGLDPDAVWRIAR